ncbi:MAG: response regulator, partial [Mariniphaga sp.]
AQDVSGLRILVVDDNASAREILQSILGSLKFDATAVSSGGEAIGELEQAHLEHKPYALVLMDWMMPGMDGVETIKRIRADIHLAKIPAFVMVTAYSREELMVRADGVQIDGVLVKPVSPSTLLDSILNALGKDVGKQARKQEKLANYKEAAERVRGAHLLLVEDNLVNQELATEILQDAGLTVDVANNGLEAVEMVAKKAYDGVLMDCQMPVMDGFEATRQIRKDARFTELPILAMTANAMAGDKEKCVEAGMNDHIAKPIDVAQLFLTLASWVKILPVSVQPSPAEPVQEVPAPSVSIGGLPGIEGLDLEGAMARVGGSAKLLRKLVVRFVETQELVMDRIKAAMEASDTNTAIREAHTVKGLAGNIGAGELANAAALVEGMLNRGETSGFVEALNAMEAQLASQLVSIRAALGLEAPAATVVANDPLGHSDLAPELQKLARLLADSDSEASDVAEELEERLKALNLGSLVKELMKGIAEFDFDTALDRLKDIAAKLGTTL